MNRSELVAAAADKCGLSNKDVDAALRGVQDAIGEAVGQGDKVSIAGFLTVEQTHRSARTGRNPRTGDSIDIPASTGVKVSAGSGLKNAVK